LENPILSRILRQISRNQRFIYHLGSSYALLGLNMIVMFVLTPLLIRHFGKEGYGIWLLLFGITNFFNLSSFGFGQTFTLELIKKQNKPKDVNRLVNTLLFSLFFFACCSFPIFLTIQFNLALFKISAEYLHIASKGLWLIYLVFFISFLAQLPTNILFARNKLALRNGIDMGKAVLNFVLTYWIISKGGGIVQLAAITVLVTLLHSSALLIASKQYLDFELHFKHYSKKLFYKFLKPSLHFFLIGLAMQIIVYSDSVLVSSLQSPALVAAYTIALRIPDVSMRLIFKIADVKIPKIPVLYDSAEWLKLWLLHNRLLWITVGAAGAIAVFLTFFGSNIIHLWLGKEFVLNQTLLVIFCLNMFTQCVFHVPAIFIQSLGMHQRSSVIAIIGAPISVITAWYFSKIYGLEGIAAAMCGTQFLVGLLVVPQFYQFIFSHLRKGGKSWSLFSLQ